MSLPALILAILGIAGAAAGVAAWYKQDVGEKALKLAQTINDMQKDENSLLARKNAYLQGQMDIKDETIERLVSHGNNTRTKK